METAVEISAEVRQKPLNILVGCDTLVSFQFLKLRAETRKYQRMRD
jgi:hypothetical protein